MEWIMDIASAERQSRIKQEWKRFLAAGECGGEVRKEVRDSWNRCRILGTDPYLEAPEKLTDSEEISRRLERNRNLIHVSRPAIRNLYDFNAGSSRLFVSVSDADGYLLLVHSDQENVQPKKSILYTRWDEKSIGNNPIGTSIHEKRPVVVIGYEHYCMYPHYYAGAGAPIRDPRGNIIGAISVTGITKLAHYHTLGMTVMTAYAIERELKILETLAEVDKAYKHRSAIIDSISEGVVIIDDRQKISFINGVFRNMCGSQYEKERFIGDSIFEYFKDPLVKTMICKNAATMDFVTEFRTRERVIPCTITFRGLGDHYKEGVIVINELSRVKKLAKRINDISRNFSFDDIVGENERFRESIAMAKSFAAADSNVLLLGESGTGKEVFAQAIHSHSDRKHGPFVPVNCGAIPKELIASELFGYVEGAFTGAKKGGNIGKFEQAANGTIFLDEIGEMPMELQSTLLRVLETRVICKVGDHNYIPINVRVIAATNKNLLQEVERRNFRKDLYYRLNILSLVIMPLRERKDDIVPLTKYFLAGLNSKHGKSVYAVSREAWERLTAYSWPGNIRELTNALERCVALSTGNVLTAELLPREIRENQLTNEYGGAGNLERVLTVSAAGAEKKEFGAEAWNLAEDAGLRELMVRTLEKNRWNATKTAKELGISRATFYRRLKELHIE